MQGRLNFIKTHPLFLGGLLGSITSKQIMTPKEADELFRKAFVGYPEYDGYTALALSLSEPDFTMIKKTVLDLKIPDQIKPTEPLEILKRTLATAKYPPYQNLLRIIYTKTIPDELVSKLVN